MLDKLRNLASKYADMQHRAVPFADDSALRRHIGNTLRRCLPASMITDDVVSCCFAAIHTLPCNVDPMYTGAIHAFAGRHLLDAVPSGDSLLTRLHHSATRLLPIDRPATRDDLRLVTLDALYTPGLFPPGIHTAYLHHRLGLGSTRLSNEEIALRMHKPLMYIHELEAAILTILTSHNTGGPHA